MLTIPRTAVRQFLQVLRKAGLLKSLRTQRTACARLSADGQQLTFQAMDHELSVAWTMPHVYQAATLIVPLALMVEASQRTEGDVTVGLANGRLLAAWTDRGLWNGTRIPSTPATCRQFPPYRRLGARIHPRCWPHCGTPWLPPIRIPSGTRWAACKSAARTA